jgi:hypothetical protein
MSGTRRLRGSTEVVTDVVPNGPRPGRRRIIAETQEPAGSDVPVCRGR